MSASSSASRSASVALAALLACGAVSPVRAETPMPSREPILRSAATDPATAGIPERDPAAAPAEPAASGVGGKEPSSDAKSEGRPAAAGTGSPPSDYAPPPASAEQGTSPPAAPVVEAPKPPSDPLGAAVFARLHEAAPLLPRLRTREREAMQAFYALGDFRPVWVENRAFTPAANAVIERLRAAGEDGLDANAYPVPVLGKLSRPDTEAEIAEADLKFSAAVLLYARDARGGRVNLAAISRLITPTLDLPAADAVLGRLAGAGDKAGDLLQAYNPATPGYLALKSRLAALRGRRPQGTPTVQLPPGPVLKLGMSDARVPLLRSRFGLEGRASGTLDSGSGTPEGYDQGVADAVARFQRSRGLPANGTLTRATVAALADPGLPAPSGNEADLLVNMERWRWLPTELGSDYVFVNVPEFKLRAFRSGVLRDETRVIVGKPQSPTPTFSGMMEYAVVNPSWYVPPSILKQMLASGKTAGYEVVRRGNAISLRQPPGERNALGFIKFMFPNQHSVYLHDTPNRSLFSAATRAFSHGCVRVEDPFRFADAVLPDWTEARLKKLIGKGERTLRLPEKLPVHLAYFTAFVDDAGSYRTAPDLYGYDGAMKAALGLAPRSDAVARLPAIKRPAADPPIRETRREAARSQHRPTPAPQRVRREPVDMFGDPWGAEVSQREPRSFW